MPHPQGVVGIFPANRTDDGEDVEVYTDQGRSEVKAKFCMLRQQAEKDNEPYFSQADFVAPKGHADHLGMLTLFLSPQPSFSSYSHTNS